MHGIDVNLHAKPPHLEIFPLRGRRKKMNTSLPIQTDLPEAAPILKLERRGGNAARLERWCVARGVGS